MTNNGMELKACPIKEVYERFKHMDGLLSDREWLKGDDEDGWLLRSMAFEMWDAIKKQQSRTPPSGVELKECSHGLKRHYGCSDKPPSGGDPILAVVKKAVELGLVRIK